jgi:hypothetical protein
MGFLVGAASVGVGFLLLALAVALCVVHPWLIAAPVAAVAGVFVWVRAHDRRTSGKRVLSPAQAEVYARYAATRMAPERGGGPTTR